MTAVAETVTLMVEPKTRELGKGLTKLIVDVKAALHKGLQLVEVLAIANAIVVDLVPVLQDVVAVPVEAKDDLLAEATTALLIGSDIVKALKG